MCYLTANFLGQLLSVEEWYIMSTGVKLMNPLLCAVCF